MTNNTPSLNTSTPRVILFMTAACTKDIPVSEPTLACLLTLGTSTFAERILDSCAQAGIKELDLVVSEYPERLRQVLKDGWKWGIKLNWHLVKDGTTPYAIFKPLSNQNTSRWLIGHGQRWVDSFVIEALMAFNQTARVDAPDHNWTGWFSVESSQLLSLSTYADECTLAERIGQESNQPTLFVPPRAFAHTETAQDLLAAQQQVLRNTQELAPATWRQFPWGAAHPSANIHPQAHIEGPVLLGPRCMVGKEAHIGPNVTLSHDVLISGGAIVKDALVLPNTYVSSTVSLDQVLVQGNHVHHLKWSTQTQIPSEDGILTVLNEKQPPRNSWLGRLLAAILFLALSPLALCLALWQFFKQRDWYWQSTQAVIGMEAETGIPKLLTVRTSHPNSGHAGFLLGQLGGLLDLAQGRRQWLGLRPRDEAQWYALRHDWQLLFNQQPIGLLHAPVWKDDHEQADLEGAAAADAFLVVQPGKQAFISRFRTYTQAITHQFSLVGK